MNLESVGTPVLWIGFVDSIPAIFAVTRDLFIVYTSASLPRSWRGL
jgi:hypothetical protein